MAVFMEKVHRVTDLLGDTLLQHFDDLFSFCYAYSKYFESSKIPLKLKKNQIKLINKCSGGPLNIGPMNIFWLRA